MNPYRVLGVDRSADDATIKKAYKKLAKQYHPDRNDGRDEKFKEINAAFDVLKDPAKRKAYDTFGTTNGPPPGGFPGGGGGFPGGGFGGGFGGAGDGVNIDDLISSMFGMGGAGGDFRRQAQGRDQHTTMTLDPMLAITGGETTVVVPQTGGGRNTIRIRIPAGVEDGKSLRLRGKGSPPPGGGPAGDLHIKLQIPEHPRLKRRGLNLDLDVPITIGEAMQGATIQVPTPTGEVSVKVPPGSTSGTRLRLRGRGVQAKKGPGDLYLILRPTPPTSHDEAVLAAVEVLEAAYDGSVRDDFTL